jgi:hypothetical protein
MRAMLFIALAALSAACASQSSAVNPRVASSDSAHPLCVRAEAGNLWWSYHEWTEPHALWALPGNEVVSDLRVSPRQSLNGYDDEQGYRVTFQRDGRLWEGEVGADHKPVGDLVPVRALTARAPGAASE